MGGEVYEQRPRLFRKAWTRARDACLISRRMRIIGDQVDATDIHSCTTVVLGVRDQVPEYVAPQSREAVIVPPVEADLHEGKNARSFSRTEGLLDSFSLQNIHCLGLVSNVKGLG